MGINKLNMVLKSMGLNFIRNTYIITPINLIQTSLSLPGSPGSTLRRRSKSGRRRGEKVLSTYMDAQEHLPYADDSTAATPLSEDNGAIIVTNYRRGS